MKENTITLSGRFDSTQNSILKLINGLNKQINALGDLSNIKTLTIDLSNIEYIDSNLSVIIYAYIKQIDNNNEIEIFIKVPNNTKVKEVFYKNNFCSLWKEDSSTDYNMTYIKIQDCQKISDCVSYTTGLLTPQFDKVQMPKENQYELFQAIFELNNNSFQHGKCDSLFICGQFFPNNHSLNLTYINFGKTFKQNYIGFMKNQNRPYNQMPISWAKQHGTSSSNSAGVGLMTFFDCLKKYNSEVIFISENEIFTRSKDFEQDIYAQTKFDGCIINIKFNLNEANCIK